jgi:protocatechuate 3,4-dioxygenase alpha subunit
VRIPTGEATIGPFFPPRYVDQGANDLTVFEGRKAKGEAIQIHGRVMQEDGSALENLIVEIWQPDAGGIFRHPADPRHAQADPDFLGWGRAATDAKGGYRFKTVRPGAPEGRLAHINFMVMFSGVMRILKTTMFFGEGPDPVLDAVPILRKKFLVAVKRENIFIFDIRLRGENETPFFDD